MEKIKDLLARMWGIPRVSEVYSVLNTTSDHSSK